MTDTESESEVGERMGKKRPCCDKRGLKKGPWSTEEDQLLVSYITKHGHGQWRSLPKFAGLQRCGKSCRLRWTNYLRPDIIRGHFTDAEEKVIIQLHAILGNKWAAIASQLPGRTDNEIKNLWNTSLRKRLTRQGINPQTHQPISTCYNRQSSSSSSSAPITDRHMAQWESAKLEAEIRLSRDSGNTQVLSSDPFLRLWKSEVGDAFRKIPTNAPAHQSSNNCDAIAADVSGSACSSSVSYQLDDLSDSAFQLLMMDCCLFNNDNGFFADNFIF